jgi:hypothetical protein
MAAYNAFKVQEQIWMVIGNARLMGCYSLWLCVNKAPCAEKGTDGFAVLFFKASSSRNIPCKNMNCMLV